MRTLALARSSFVGAAPVTINEVALMAVPPAVITVIGPVVAPAGTCAVICAEVLTSKPAFTPLNRTAVAPVKFAPEMVTLVPAGPAVGLKPKIEGAVAAARE